MTPVTKPHSTHTDIYGLNITATLRRGAGLGSLKAKLVLRRPADGRAARGRGVLLRLLPQQPPARGGGVDRGRRRRAQHLAPGDARVLLLPPGALPSTLLRAVLLRAVRRRRAGLLPAGGVALLRRLLLVGARVGGLLAVTGAGVGVLAVALLRVALRVRVLAGVGRALAAVCPQRARVAGERRCGRNGHGLAVDDSLLGRVQRLRRVASRLRRRCPPRLRALLVESRGRPAHDERAAVHVLDGRAVPSAQWRCPGLQQS